MMHNRHNTQDNSMMASHFCITSVATINIKHFYYQIIHNTCWTLTCSSPAWLSYFCTSATGPHPDLMQQYLHSLFLSGVWRRRDSTWRQTLSFSSSPCPPTASLGNLQLGTKPKTGSSPTARSDKVKQRGLVSGDTLPSFRVSKPTAHLYQRFKHDNKISPSPPPQFGIKIKYFYPSLSEIINVTRKIFVAKQLICLKSREV